MNKLFNNVTKFFWERIGNGIEIVVATSSKDYVTARTIFAIPMNGKLYFPTWNSTTKYNQIKNNNKVALSTGAIQLTGIAHDIGHPNDIVNKSFSDSFRMVFPDGFDDFCNSPEAVVIEVEPVEIMFNQIGSGDMYKANFHSKTAEKLSYKEMEF